LMSIPSEKSCVRTNRSHPGKCVQNASDLTMADRCPSECRT
jgi:hypothetical protein